MTRKFVKSPLLPALLLAVALTVGIHFSDAQTQQPGATPVQQAQPFYNCNQTATVTGLGNGSPTLTTVTPPAGQFVYICAVYISEVANAAVTGAAGPAPIFTSTNLQNQLVWWGDNSSLTIGQQKLVADEVFPLLVKAASPGVPVTVVTSAGQSTQNVRINLEYFVAQ